MEANMYMNHADLLIPLANTSTNRYIKIEGERKKKRDDGMIAELVS